MWTKQLLLSFSGLVLVLLAVLARWAVFPPLFQAAIETQLELVPGTIGFKKWAGEESIVPAFKRFTVFNFTNPEGTKAGEKPIVVEVGPFTYKRRITKTKIQTRDGGQTFSYGLHREFVFDKSESCADCFADTNVTIINFPLLIVMDLIKASDSPLAGIINLPDIINLVIGGYLGDKYKDDLFITVKVEDLLYHGITTGLLAWVHSIVPQFPATIALGENSTTSWFSVNSGKNDIVKYTEVEEYNGGQELPENYWKSCGPTPSANKSGLHGTCHDIFGTDGSQQKFDMHDDTIWIFNDELCRSFPMDFTRHKKILGIPANRYEISKDVMDNQRKENLCYCPYIDDCAVADSEEGSWNVTKCSEVCPRGTLNLRGCKNNLAIIVSKPHFLDGDASLHSAVGGMFPDHSLHQSYIDLEPLTGLSLTGHFKIQINSPLERNSAVKILRNVRNLLFPVVWFDICSDVDQENADLLHSVLLLPVTVLNAVVGGVIAVGVLLLTVVAVIRYRNWRHKK